MKTGTTDFAPSRGSVTRLVFSGARELSRLIRAWRHRREVTRLLGADDRMLADIGLTRFDVEAAIAAPPSLDPSHMLIRARAERRAGSRTLHRSM